MKRTTPHHIRVLGAACLALAAAAASAAATSVDLRNDTTLNYGFLFAGDPAAVQFTALGFKNDFRGWTLDVLTPAVAVFSGPTVAPRAGRLHLTFDYAQPQVGIEWAEVLFDGVDYGISASGTATFTDAPVGQDVWSSSSTFSAANGQFIDAYFGGATPAPVPLPNALVLMLPAAFLLCTPRGRR